MTDLELFRGLAKQVPLEPITDAETYFAACEIQATLAETPEPAVHLYLQALAPIVAKYEEGYRAD